MLLLFLLAVIAVSCFCSGFFWQFLGVGVLVSICYFIFGLFFCSPFLAIIKSIVHSILWDCFSLHFCVVDILRIQLSCFGRTISWCIRKSEPLIGIPMVKVMTSRLGSVNTMNCQLNFQLCVAGIMLIQERHV